MPLISAMSRHNEYAADEFGSDLSSKEDLVNSGSSMNPKNITDSEYWVMTNSNTTRKKMMLHEVALSLGYSNEQAEKIRDYL